MAPPTAEELLSQIAQMRRFSRAGYVAPNKPITLLWALARLEEGEPRLCRFAAAEPELQPLLDGYARYRTSPIHAFWALRNDGFWEVTWEGEMVPRLQGREPTLTSMRAHASGGFRQEAFALLAASPELRRAATLLLREKLQGGLATRLPVPRGGGCPRDDQQVEAGRRLPGRRVGPVRCPLRCLRVAGEEGGWSGRPHRRPCPLAAGRGAR